VRPNRAGDVVGQARQFGGQHRGDTERRAVVGNAPLPISGIGAKLLNGVEFPMRQLFDLRPNDRARLLDDRNREIVLAREMVVDTRLSDADSLSDVGIAESIIAQRHDQAPSFVDDPLRSRSAHVSTFQ
jgi:hypothetical protein